MSVRQADICGQLELFDRGPVVVAARADSDKTARLARTGLGSCGAAGRVRPEAAVARRALGADNCRRGAARHPSADGDEYVLAALVQDTAHHVGNKLTLYARHRRAAAGDGGKAQG